MLAGNATGQAIPNPSFENWSERPTWGYLPRDWYGTNYKDYGYIGVTRESHNPVDVQFGQFYVKMEAKSVSFFGTTYKAPGGITLSDLYYATGVNLFKEGKPKAGVPFAGTPSRVTGYYKFTSVNNASYYMSAVLTKWRGSYRDTIAIAEKMNSQSVNEWTLFELELDYKIKEENPDTMNIVFLTSAVFKESDMNLVQPGTTLEIDNLGLIMADYFEVDFTTEGTPCTGNTLTFKASSENIPPTRWEWYIGTLYAGNLQTLSYQFPEVTEPTNFNVRLRGVSPIGNDEVTKTVTIHPKPDIRLMPENPEICPGSTITLTATGGESYIWNTTGVDNNQITNPVINFTYEIIGKDQFGCTNTASSRVFPYDPIPPTLIQATFCPGTEYEFYGQELKIPGEYHYTDKSKKTGCDSVIVLTLTEKQVPNITITANIERICPGQSVVLTATEGFKSYNWGQSYSANNTLVVSPNETATYFLTAETENGCPSINRTLSGRHDPAMSLC